MRKRIRVCVMHREGHRYFEAQWKDPVTGKKRTRSTGKTTRSEAVRVAAKLEAEIESGRFDSRPEIKWADFWKRYKDDVLSGLSPKTLLKACGTYNAVCDLISPQFVSSLDTAQVSCFQTRLRATKIAEATIKSHLAALRAALRWGEQMGLIDRAPQFQMPRRTSGMKGRPITHEEFERIREKAAAVVTEPCAPSWIELLDGLWWSGLRLGEALALHWTDDRELCVDLSGRRPMFRIQAGAEKGNQFRVLPMAPEFAEFLDAVSARDRRGYVFNPAGPEGRGRPQLDWVSKTVCRMGKAAGVKVSERRTTDDDDSPVAVIKYASAHDFRRSFGVRWAMRVMPVVLREMMRHSSIETTMKYYVGHNAEATADAMWDVYANTPANKLSK